MNIRKQMDDIYGGMSLEQIPWNLTQPPQLLVEAVESGQIKPCKAVDLGCGAGNYAVWLAGMGFDMTGFDISPKAIEIARKLAEDSDVSCRFEAVDMLGDMSKYYGYFDFAFDWEVLHHIMPEDRPRYLDNIQKILKSEGIYFSVSFSDKDTAFSGGEKYHMTQLGTTLYFSSEEELRELYLPRFEIIELKDVEITGKHGPHRANAARLRAKAVSVDL